MNILKLEQIQVQTIKSELGEKFDKKLKSKYALAPVDLRKSNQVNSSNYDLHNKSYSDDCNNFMLRELDKIVADYGKDKFERF